MRQIIQVKVISPQDVLFDAEAISVSSKNTSGNFDILAQHANFITIIENQPIVIRTIKKEKISFQFPLAVIYTINNKVSVYAETGSSISEE